MPLGALGADDAALLQTVQDSFAPRRPDRLGVAVSGGSDSLALLHLLAGWPDGPTLLAVTVDHGLRPEAAAETAGVGQICAGLGVPHQVLHWQWDGHGNLSDQARQARLRLIAAWALANRTGVIALGHTADDQAETFLMRLARGSGVDGLSAMSSRRHAKGVEWVRPLLRLRRSDLRAYLTRRGVVWADDPTNEDTAYQRVRARAAMAALVPLGITPDTIGDTVSLLSLARAALEKQAQQAAQRIARIEGGDVILDRMALIALPYETQLRLLAHAIRWVSSAVYRPRLNSLTEVHSALILRKRRTLGGCLLSGTLQSVRISREWQAVRALTGPTVALWDGRWLLNGPHSSALHVGPLSADGLAQLPGWRACGIPRSSLLASPAVWCGADLVAAPLAGFGADWVARLARGEQDFFTSILTH